MDGGRGSARCERSQEKLEHTPSLSSSHAKKLAFLYQNVVFGRIKKLKCFVNMN